MKKLLLAVIAITVSATLAFGASAQSTSTPATRSTSTTPSTSTNPANTEDQAPDAMKKEEDKAKKEAMPQTTPSTLAQREGGFDAALFVADAATPSTPADKSKDEEKNGTQQPTAGAAQARLLVNCGDTSSTPADKDAKKDDKKPATLSFGGCC